MTTTASVPSRSSVASDRFTATVGFAASAMLVGYLPLSGANGVLGLVGASQHVGADALRWVTSAFTVALTAAVLVGGALAERHGRRRVTVAGLLLVALGSSAGFVAGGLPGVRVLWLAQALSGLGGGLVMAATLSLIATSAPSSGSRTRAITVWAAANVVGLGAGPFLSGSIASLAGWRWFFLPVAALALGVAVAGRGVVDAVPTRVGHLDLAVLPRRLVTTPAFTAACVAAAGALFTVIGTVFALTLLLADRHVGQLGIASRLGLLFLGNAIASVVSGPVQTRLGSRRVLVGSLLVAVAGSASLLAWDGGRDVGDLAWRLLLLGAGCGAVVATSTAVAVGAVPGSDAVRAGTGSNVVRQLGGALGPVVVGGVLSARLADGATPVAATHLALVVLLAVLTAAATTALCLVRPHH